MNHVIDSERFGSRRAATHAAGGSGGGKMDDVLKRLGAVEAAVSEIRSQVSAIVAVLPHLATKADLSAEVSSLRSDMHANVSSLRSDMHSMEASLIKWIVSTTIASVAVAAAVASVIAKYMT